MYTQSHWAGSHFCSVLACDNSIGPFFSQAGFLQRELAAAAAVPAEWECYYMQDNRCYTWRFIFYFQGNFTPEQEVLWNINNFKKLMFNLKFKLFHTKNKHDLISQSYCD